MPAITAKCYMVTPLEVPNLDPEGAFAIHHDLGMAVDGAGNLAVAVEKLIEVYSHNIYRGVAEELAISGGAPGRRPDGIVATESGKTCGRKVL